MIIFFSFKEYILQSKKTCYTFVYKIKFNEISNTFSKNNYFTLRFGTISSGKSKIYLYTDDENFYTTRINGSSLFGAYGLEFAFIELLFG